MGRVLNVELGERRYPITFAENAVIVVADTIGALARSGRTVAVVTDANIMERQPRALGAMFGHTPLLAVKPGESAKSLDGFGQVLDFLAANKIDRTGALFAVGGGVVGDLAGFAAASWLRGIDFYQVPTTLLAMVDSSVGGKTGINVAAGKNLVGAFHQPSLVLIDPSLLDTL